MAEKEKKTETITIKTTPSIAKKIGDISQKHEWTISKTAEKLITIAIEKGLL